jgi:hypothetical protein
MGNLLQGYRILLRSNLEPRALAYGSNPGYSGGRDQEDGDSSKAAWAKTLETHHKKRARGVAQVAECLPSKCEALSSNSSTAKKTKL